MKIRYTITTGSGAIFHGDWAEVSYVEYIKAKNFVTNYAHLDTIHLETQDTDDISNVRAFNTAHVESVLMEVWQ